MNAKRGIAMSPILDFLDPLRCSEILAEYQKRHDLGMSESKIIADLAFCYAIAPSFVRILLNKNRAII